MSITDEQVEAALAAHYPGEWPDDPIFHKPLEAIITGPYAGKPWGNKVKDEMRAVLEAALPQWQPIETAPKDGSSFLACNGNWQTVCAWHRHHHCWVSNGPFYARYDPDEQPTHWMPLPRSVDEVGDSFQVRRTKS